MLCEDIFNILYKLKINRTFIEHNKKFSNKKLKKKKYRNINMKNETKIDPFGFREYDARWLYPKNINLLESDLSWKRIWNSNYISKIKKIQQWTSWA